MNREEIKAAGGVPDLYDGSILYGCVHGEPPACKLCTDYDEAQKRLPQSEREPLRRDIGLVGGTAAMWRLR